MKEEQQRKIARLAPQIRKELNEAFGLFLTTKTENKSELQYGSDEQTAPIERGLFRGTISALNLKTILRALGYEPRRDELKKLLLVVDSAD